MNPLDYAILDAYHHPWAPPTNPARSLGAHICLVKPYFTRVSTSAGSPNGEVICAGRLRTHLPTPHAGSCPLDYASLYVTLHRRQKEKLLQVHASRPVPLLGRQSQRGFSPVSSRTARWPPNAVAAAVTQLPSAPSQNAPEEDQQQLASRVSTSTHRGALSDGLTTVVVRPVPASVAAVMAQVATTTAASATAASTPVGPASPHHHHYHDHHGLRPSAETRAPSTQQSPIMPRHHHHHHPSSTARPRQTPAPAASPHAAAPTTTAATTTTQPQPHMRYRVGRSGSTQLQPLPTTVNGEVAVAAAQGLGAGVAGMVAAAAAEAAAREVAASGRRAAISTQHRRSPSPFSSLPSSASTSLPREASATPLSLALSSIRRSGTRGSSSAAAASGLTRLTLPVMRGSHYNSLRRSTSVDTASDPANAVMGTPNVLADTRMFLRPPQHSLREERGDYTSDDAHAALLLAGSPAMGTTTLYRSDITMGGNVTDTVEGAGAVSAERQQELQLQLQRALQRQRQLEQLMFHDCDDENTIGGGLEGEEEEYDDDVESTDGTEGRPSSGHHCRSRTGWDDGFDDDTTDPEPLWRSSPHTQVLHYGTHHTLAFAAPPQPQRIPSVHPHEHVSLSRFQDTPAGGEGSDDLGIRADSVLEVPRGWREGFAGRARSSTTSPSPQPDAFWTRWHRHQQRRGGGGLSGGGSAEGPHQRSYHNRRHQPSGSATTAEGSPVPIPASATTAMVSRSAAMAPTSSRRGGSGSDTDAFADVPHMPPTATASPSMLSLVITALRGPSSTSYASPSLPQPTEASTPRGTVTVDAADDTSSGEGDSPTLPLPVRQPPAYQPSVPSAAFTDLVRDMTTWKSDSTERAEAGAAAASPAPSASVPNRIHHTAAVSSSSSSSSPSWRHSVPQVDEDGIVACTRRRGQDVAADEGGVAVACASPSSSLPASGGSDSPSPTAQAATAADAAAEQREPRTSSAFLSLDGAADCEVPAVRRTSPGLSAPSSTCTRLSADDDRSRSDDAGAGVVGVHNSDRRRGSSPSPQLHHLPEEEVEAEEEDESRAAMAAKGAAQTTQVAGPRGTTAAAAAVPMVYLADMLRLSLSPGSDESASHEGGNSVAVNCALLSAAGTAGGCFPPEMTAATPPRRTNQFVACYLPRVESQGEGCPRDSAELITMDLCVRYPHRDSGDSARAAAAERSGVTTASISSSPPSPNRTAIRHAGSLLADDDDDDDDDGVDINDVCAVNSADHPPATASPMSGSSPFSQRRTPAPPFHAAATVVANASTPLTPAAVASRLTLSTDERHLHASTTSTVAWSTTMRSSAPAMSGIVIADPQTPLGQPRFSDDSVLSATTSAGGAAAGMFSTPAQTRLQSLLRASTWAASVSSSSKTGNMLEEETDRRGGDDMCTPRRGLETTHVTPHNMGRTSAEMQCSDKMSGSPATPLQRVQDSPADAGAAAAVVMRHSTMMPPPQASPFRGSGSFLRLQPSWSGYGCPNGGEEGGRPSDGFEADIQLLARMTCMTIGGGGSSSSVTQAPAPAPQAPSACLSPPKQQQTAFHLPGQHQRANSSPSSSPSRFSTNSLSFFIAAAATATSGGSPGGLDAREADLSGRLRSGSGVYGSAVACRRSWAPRKARPERRGKQRRPRASANVSGGGGSSRLPRHDALTSFSSSSRARDPYHQLCFMTELASQSSSARPSRGEESGGSNSGVFVPPQRLTFGSAIASLTTTTTTATTTAEGPTDSGERWSTAWSTPSVVALPQQPQPRYRKARASPPSYYDALSPQLSEAGQPHAPVQFSESDDGTAGDDLRSPSLSSLHWQDPTAQQQQQQAWVHPASTSPPSARTPSGRPSLSSSEFLRAPQRFGQRGDRRRSWTPSINALPAYPSLFNGAAVWSGAAGGSADSSARQRSLSTSGTDRSEHRSGEGGVDRCAPPRRPRRADRAASFSAARSPSATGVRLTWGTAIATTTSSEARAGAFSFSPVRSARQRSSSSSFSFHNSSSTTSTPMRVPYSRTSDLLMDRPSAAPLPTSSAPPLSLADELRSFSNPIFGPAPTFLASPLRRSGVQPPPAHPAFLAAPSCTEGGSGGPSSMSLPPQLQALLLSRGPATATRGVGPVTTSSAPAAEPSGQEICTPQKTAPASADPQETSPPSMKTPQQRRGCSERPEVNVEVAAASASPPRQASP